MTAIVLEASETSAGTLGTEAMTLPEQGATLLWWFGKEYGRNYIPHLVKAIAWDGTTLQFRGIKLADRTVEIGPTSDTDTFEVVVSNENYALAVEPSTLNNLTATGAKKYAILLLTARFLEENDSNERLSDARTTGGSKYPQRAEALRALMELRELKEKHAEVMREVKELRELKEKHERALNEVKLIAFLDRNTQADKLRGWLEQYAP